MSLFVIDVSVTAKTAVIHGAGGAAGHAVARALAREGARVLLTGRNLSNVDAIAKGIMAAGGRLDRPKSTS